MLNMKKNIMFGDIITYIDDNHFVTHRIVSKNNKSIITKGDNNNAVDSEVKQSRILGKVVFDSIILGNFIRKYLKYVFILFTILIIIVNIYFFFKENRNNEKVKD